MSGTGIRDPLPGEHSDATALLLGREDSLMKKNPR